MNHYPHEPTRRSYLHRVWKIEASGNLYSGKCASRKFLPPYVLTRNLICLIDDYVINSRKINNAILSSLLSCCHGVSGTFLHHSFAC